MVNLITEHIDIWTAAQTHKNNGGRGRGRNSNAQSPHGIKKLRELILELAVRGKLEPQHPNDEPASVLLEKIAKEKARLIKEGKIKKQKPLPEISENEKPFEIPPGWEWARLQTLVFLLGDGLHGTPNYTPGTSYYFVNGNNLNNGKIEIKPSTKTVSFEELLKHKKELSSNSILVSINGTLGNVAFYNGEEIILGKSACYFNLSKYMSKHFIKKVIESPYFVSYAFRNATGSTIKNLSLKAMNGFPLPLPPIAEQHRIVAKVDELMTLCDKREQQQTVSNATHQALVETLLATLTNAADEKESAKAWQRIANHFGTLFTTEQSIDQLKQTILQLAVMGKLVPQDPDDKSASDLLDKIAKEKARLIKENKIKKQKPLPEISEDEKPFELPEGWAVVRLGNVINLISGQHLKPQEYLETMEQGMVPYLTGPAEFGEQYPAATRFTYERRALATAGDILITCKGSGVGKLNIADTEIAISRQLMSIQPIIAIPNYIKLLAQSMNKSLRASIVGIAIPGISRENITEAIVMMPPLSEQNRIVAKVDELMALCSALKDRLDEAQTTQVQLADTIVAQAVI